MKRFHFTALGGLVAALLGTSACHPDQPTTKQPTTDQSASPPAMTQSVISNVSAYPADTLHLPGNHVVLLRPTTALAFNQLPISSLSEDIGSESPEAAWLASTGGRVRRRGLDLLLRPQQGPVVRLHSTPESARKNDAVSARYMYWGSLPSAHQWVVQTWYWRKNGTVLVDQRTGRRLEVAGWPSSSPDGRYVLVCSGGVDGGTQASLLRLVAIMPAGARLLWQVEPTTWEPVEARWAAPNRVVLMRRHARPDGSLADDARVTYDELTLPR